ncbi:MAG: hypothetical protein KFF68_04370 [Desulfosarcina sp.]|nr:hypothetical protein [Desulfosarcina sp.]
MNGFSSPVKPDPETVIAVGDVRIPVVAYGRRWLVVEKPGGMSIIPWENANR